MAVRAATISDASPIASLAIELGYHATEADMASCISDLLHQVSVVFDSDLDGAEAIVDYLAPETAESPDGTLDLRVKSHAKVAPIEPRRGYWNPRQRTLRAAAAAQQESRATIRDTISLA